MLSGRCWRRFTVVPPCSFAVPVVRPLLDLQQPELDVPPGPLRARVSDRHGIRIHLGPARRADPRRWCHGGLLSGVTGRTLVVGRSPSGRRPLGRGDRYCLVSGASHPAVVHTGRVPLVEVLDSGQHELLERQVEVGEVVSARFDNGSTDGGLCLSERGTPLSLASPTGGAEDESDKKRS